MSIIGSSYAIQTPVRKRPNRQTVARLSGSYHAYLPQHRQVNHRLIEFAIKAFFLMPHLNFIVDAL